MREPPGCPPGPPPDIDDDGEITDFSTKLTTEDDIEGEEDVSSDTEAKTVKPTSLQQKMVALSGQNVDDFIKEMETVQKKIETNREEENRAKLTAHIEPLVPPGIVFYYGIIIIPIKHINIHTISYFSMWLW